jgi:hypothetical protein
MIAFIAAVALSFSLQGLCPEAGPDDPPGWDYNCAGVTLPSR